MAESKQNKQSGNHAVLKGKTTKPTAAAETIAAKTVLISRGVLAMMRISLSDSKNIKFNTEFQMKKSII